jgi:hypothetical protein
MSVGKALNAKMSSCGVEDIESGVAEPGGGQLVNDIAELGPSDVTIGLLGAVPRLSVG